MNTTGNNFLANGGTELNTTSNLYDLAYRNYDPVLGRMNGVDPMASKYSSVSPYNYSFNDPVALNDPSGADPYSSRSSVREWMQNSRLDGGRGRTYYDAHAGMYGTSFERYGPGNSLSYSSWLAMRAELDAARNGDLDATRSFLARNSRPFSGFLESAQWQLTVASGAPVGVASNPARFTGGSHENLYQNIFNGDFVQWSNGRWMVPYTDITYESALAARSVESSSGDNWFNEHFYFEQQVRVSGGLQATLVPTKEGLLVLPYSSGNEYLSINIDAGSRTLMDVTGNNVSGVSTTTYENNVMTYGIGISYKGGNLNFQNTYDGTGESRWNTSLTFGRAGLGVGLSSDGYFSIGSMMQNKWALGLGAEYNLTQTFRFKIF